MNTAAEIRTRCRAVAVQSMSRSAADDEDDRWDQIEQARLALARAAEHLKHGSVLMADQAMAEAAGYLL